MYIIYNLILTIVSILSSPFLLYTILTNKRYRIGLSERLLVPCPITATRPIWIHAASVGEVKLAVFLIKEIKTKWSGQDIVLSVFTDTGMNTAKELLSDVPIFFFPLDLPFVMKRTIKTLSPVMFLIIESEIWPNLLYLLKKHNIPILLLNGRISKKSYKSYKKVSFFIGRIIKNISFFSMRGKEDANRVIDLGASSESVRVAGNLKYEYVLEKAGTYDLVKEKERLFITDRPKIVIFGCTRDGEEKDLCELFNHLIKNGVTVIVAPRHVNRVGKLEKLFKLNSFSYILLSKIKNSSDVKGKKIIIVDTIGQLFSLYSLSTIAFVGGSLKPFGGQNILEPAVFGIPVFFGRYMSNFQEEATALISDGGGRQFSSVSEIQEAIDELFNNENRLKKMGRSARNVVEKNKGAAQATIDAIGQFL